MRTFLYITALSANLNILVGAISTFIVARLLAPEQVGVAVLAATIVGLVEVLRNFGIGAHVVRSDVLLQRHVRSVVGVLLLTTVVTCGLLIIASPWLSEFFRRPDLEPLLGIYAFGLVVAPWAIPGAAVLQREMRYRRLAIVGMASALSQAGVTALLAWSGEGPSSLAWGSVVGRFVEFACLLLLNPTWTLLRPSFVGWVEPVRFGSLSNAASLAGAIGFNSASLVVSKMLSVEAAAYYNRGYQLIDLFRRSVLATVVTVALPAFSAEHREGPDRAILAFCRAIGLLTAVAWPFLAFAHVFADDVVAALYGPQWGASVPVAKILIIGFAAYIPSVLATEYLVAVGQVSFVTLREWVIQPVRIALLVAAVPYGLEAVAWATAATYAIATVANCFGSGILRANPGSLFRAAIEGSGIAACCWINVWILRGAMPHEHYSVWLRLVCGGCVLAVTWLCLIFLIRHPLSLEIRRLVVRARHQGR